MSEGGDVAVSVSNYRPQSGSVLTEAKMDCLFSDSRTSRLTTRNGSSNSKQLLVSSQGERGKGCEMTYSFFSRGRLVKAPLPTSLIGLLRISSRVSCTRPVNASPLIVDRLLRCKYLKEKVSKTANEKWPGEFVERLGRVVRLLCNMVKRARRKARAQGIPGKRCLR